MNKKMIVIDLDGTLLDNSGNVSNNAINYLNELIKRGHILVIASGRPFRAINDIASNFPKNMPIISENGAFIGSLDNSISTIIKSFKKEVFLKLFIDNKPIINHAFYSVFNYVYIYNYTKKLESFYHIDKNTIVIDKSYDEVEDLIAPNGVLFIINSLYKNQFENYITNNLNGIVNYRFMGSDHKNAIYEISQTVINKGYAIEKLLKHYNLSTDDLICIGDGQNDFDMLNIAKIKIAMKNSYLGLKDIATQITEYDNNNDGVYKELKRIFN